MLLGDMLDERTAIVDGYNTYFSFSRGRTGYSGTVYSGLAVITYQIENINTF